MRLLADEYPGEVDGDNVASILSASGKTWKAYAESLPRAGYLDDDRGLYVKRHVPFAYFASVRHAPAPGKSAQSANIVPFNQFLSDMQSFGFADICQLSTGRAESLSWWKSLSLRVPTGVSELTTTAATWPPPLRFFRFGS